MSSLEKIQAQPDREIFYTNERVFKDFVKMKPGQQMRVKVALAIKPNSDETLDFWPTTNNVVVVEKSPLEIEKKGPLTLSTITLTLKALDIGKVEIIGGKKRGDKFKDMSRSRFINIDVIVERE